MKLEIIAALETKPGISPSTSHLEFLLQSNKSNPVDIIIRTPYDPKDASIWLSEKTGINSENLSFIILAIASSSLSSLRAVSYTHLTLPTSDLV